MQLALDKDTHDLILGPERVELVGDVEFDLPLLAEKSKTNWYDLDESPTVNIIGGQLVISGRADTKFDKSKIAIEKKYNVVVDVASLGTILEINVGGVNIEVDSVGITTRQITLDVNSTNVIYINTFGTHYFNSFSVLTAVHGGVERVQDGRYVVQLVKSRLLTGLGEWLLDPRLGWISLADYEKNPDLFLIELRAKQIILTTPNVKSIEEFDMVLHNRVLTVTFKALTTFGLIDVTVPWGAT